MMAASITTSVTLKVPGGGNTVGPVSYEFKGQANSLHAAIISDYKAQKEVKLTVAERRRRFIQDSFGGLEGLGGEFYDKLIKQAKKKASDFRKEWVENYMEEMGLEYIPGRKPLLRKKR